jgi:hypothetical protein
MPAPKHRKTTSRKAAGNPTGTKAKPAAKRRSGKAKRAVKRNAHNPLRVRHHMWSSLPYSWEHPAGDEHVTARLQDARDFAAANGYSGIKVQ